HYLEQLHALGAELSISAGLVQVSPELAQLAEASGDTSPHRQDEPYRRAISGIYARVAAGMPELSGMAPPRPSHLPGTPYADTRSLIGDLRTISKSLRKHRGDILADGRLRGLIRAVDCFG